MPTPGIEPESADCKSDRYRCRHKSSELLGKDGRGYMNTTVTEQHFTPPVCREILTIFNNYLLTIINISICLMGAMYKMRYVIVEYFKQPIETNCAQFRETQAHVHFGLNI